MVVHLLLLALEFIPLPWAKWNVTHLPFLTLTMAALVSLTQALNYQRARLQRSLGQMEQLPSRYHLRPAISKRWLFSPWKGRRSINASHRLTISGLRWNISRHASATAINPFSAWKKQ